VCVCVENGLEVGRTLCIYRICTVVIARSDRLGIEKWAMMINLKIKNHAVGYWCAREGRSPVISPFIDVL
jgi:hypothetical protein